MERVRIEPCVVLVFNGQGRSRHGKAESQEVGQTVISKTGDCYVLEIKVVAVVMERRGWV